MDWIFTPARTTGPIDLKPRIRRYHGHWQCAIVIPKTPDWEGFCRFDICAAAAGTPRAAWDRWVSNRFRRGLDPRGIRNV